MLERVGCCLRLRCLYSDLRQANPCLNFLSNLGVRSLKSEKFPFLQ
jgi:hypothetical protein